MSTTPEMRLDRFWQSTSFQTPLSCGTERPMGHARTKKLQQPVLSAQAASIRGYISFELLRNDGYY